MMNLVGERYTKLLVVEEAETHILPGGQNSRRWLCKCDCGKTKVIHQSSLRSGLTKSCGCLMKNPNIDHSLLDSRQYGIWAGMKHRCNHENASGYEYYGGRGITYDPKWETFTGFWEDMSEGYNDNLTLDRKDFEGNYCKDNCRWATVREQARNKGMNSNNKSGVTGVGLSHDRYGNRSWGASWVDSEGRVNRRSFAAKRHGEERAFRLACEARQEAMDEMKSKGEGYSEYHGLPRNKQVKLIGSSLLI